MQMDVGTRASRTMYHTQDSLCSMQAVGTAMSPEQISTSSLSKSSTSPALFYLSLVTRA